MQGRALILGANGRFGRNAAEAFWNAGWTISAFDRTTGDLATQALGVDVIVNGWNPTYPDWERDLPRLTEEVIAAARLAGATILQPGNLYVYGPGLPATLSESTPRLARHLLGRLRIEMEQTLRQSGVQTILLRAGDFLDTEPSGNWFDHVIVKPLHRQHIAYPGPLDTPHSWAYLPDLARAAEQLARRRADLPTFSEVLFPGYTLSGREIAEIMSFALGARITAGQMPWLPLRIARPFWPMARHLFEMRYLWNRPHSVSRETFDNVLSDFRETPVDIALLRAAEHKIRPNHPMPRSKVHLGGASQGPVHS